MKVTREVIPNPDDRTVSAFEVVVAECEACGFSSVSRYEHDAVAIIERHQRQCAKALALEENARRINVMLKH